MISERRCLGCGSNDVVTPLLGMFALKLCPHCRQIVSNAHRKARMEYDESGRSAPILTEQWARDAIDMADTEAE